jgi:hypothetical protein
MTGWQEVLKIFGLLATIFVVGIWIVPKMGMTFS